MIRARLALALFLVQVCCSVVAQAPLTPGEARATRALDAAKVMGPGELYALLKTFPKGADLHMHLSGAVYAETFLAEAVKQDLCVDPEALKLAPPPCTAPLLPASTTLTNQPLYDKLIDAMSMRAYVPYAGWSGHDQFFATFPRWGALEKDTAGEWLDEVASRAAAQNEQYLEIMQTPSFTHAATLGYKLGWPADSAASVTPEKLAALRDKLLAAGLRDEVPVDIKEFADSLDKRNQMELCGKYFTDHGWPHTEILHTDLDPQRDIVPVCDLRIHFLYQILRGYPPQQVFAQTLLGFEVASADPDNVVGINFVMPEDGRISMQDYTLQMQMLDYLHSVYPNVRVSLHAGELAPGMVPFDGLSFHIRQAIDLGHALRIGHGDDVLYEDNAPALLKEMADKHVMVEINLTSNAGILDLKGKDHPLHAYMMAHVPWALSTDDEGVSRINLTHEYARGVDEQNLTYLDLKRSARTSLEHAFLHGQSLYPTPDDFARRAPVCAAPITATSKPTELCYDFLHANEKAAEEWELERRFSIFEASIR
jgi:adenosine deaminase